MDEFHGQDDQQNPQEFDDSLPDYHNEETGDTDYVNIGDANLVPGGELFAELYVDPDYDINPDDIDLFDVGRVAGLYSSEEQYVHDSAQPVPDDFDFDAETIRGPFSLEGMTNFLDETGFWDFIDGLFVLDGDYYFDVEAVSPL